MKKGLFTVMAMFVFACLIVACGRNAEQTNKMQEKASVAPNSSNNHVPTYTESKHQSMIEQIIADDANRPYAKIEGRRIVLEQGASIGADIDFSRFRSVENCKEMDMRKDCLCTFQRGAIAEGLGRLEQEGLVLVKYTATLENPYQHQCPTGSLIFMNKDFFLNSTRMYNERKQREMREEEARNEQERRRQDLVKRFLKKK